MHASVTGSEQALPSRGLGTQSLSLAASMGSAQLIVAVMYVIAARSASPERFGAMVAAIALGAVAAGFLDFGSNSFLTRELARRAIDESVAMTRLLGKVTIATVLAASALITMRFWGASTLWMAAPVGCSLVFSQAMQVHLRARAQGIRVAGLVLLDKTCALGALMALVLSGIGAVDALWLAVTLGSVVSGVGALIWRSSHPPLTRFWENPWRGTAHYGLFGVAVSAQSLDVPLTSLVGGAGAAGLYGAVNRWTAPMALLTTAYSQASLPFVASAENSREAWHRVRRTIWMPMVAALGSVIVAVTAPLVVDLLIGDQYQKSANVLSVMAVGAVFAVANQPMAVFLQSRGHERYVGYGTASVVALQLLMLIALVGSFAAMGGAWAYVIAQVLLTAVFLHGLNRFRMNESTHPPDGIGTAPRLSQNTRQLACDRAIDRPDSQPSTTDGTQD